MQGIDIPDSGARGINMDAGDMGGQVEWGKKSSPTEATEGLALE